MNRTMNKIHFHKTWLSPFVGVAFSVISVTGVLLFFHVKNGSVMALHEWFGWLFILSGLVHVALSFRALTAYLRRPAALIALGVAGVVAAGLWLGGAAHDGHHGPHGHGPECEISSSATP